MNSAKSSFQECKEHFKIALENKIKKIRKFKGEIVIYNAYLEK